MKKQNPIKTGGGLSFEVTRIYCCVPLSEEQWDRLMAYEKAYVNQVTEEDDVIQKTIKKAGGEDIEFNGHFGRNFFFGAEDHKSAKKVVRALERLLKRAPKTEMECALCSQPATHFCECPGCKSDEDSGRWLCDTCSHPS